MATLKDARNIGNIQRGCSYTVKYLKPWNPVLDGLCDIRVDDYELTNNNDSRRPEKFLLNKSHHVVSKQVPLSFRGKKTVHLILKMSK